MAAFGADILARVTTLKVGYVVPAAFLLSIGGAYAARENVWDIGIAIAAGIIGFAFNRFGFSLVTLVIGFLLGVRAELSFMQSLQMSGGSYAIFFTRSVTITLMLLSVLMLCLPWLTSRKAKKSS